MDRMRIVRVFFLTVLCLALSMATNGQSHSDSRESAFSSEQINNAQWRESGSGSFIENKGQMTDMDGKTIPSVFFKTSSPGVQVYLRDSGLTYVFTRIARETELSPGKGKNHTTGPMEMEWCRLDMILEGSSISKEQII